MSDNNFKSGYSDVNGIKMYYEIYGQGKPLVLIHGGGSNLSFPEAMAITWAPLNF